MEYLEAKEILIEVQRLFPHFNKSRDIEIAKTWMRLLQKGDYESTMKKLDEYASESSYPPNVADILVKPYKPVNTEVTDVKDMERAVQEEKADPERRKRREEKLKQFEDKLKELRRNGR